MSLTRWLKWGAGIAAGLVAVAIAVAWYLLNGSLPQLNGRIAAAGLTGPVTLDRDELGVATITGDKRADVAYVTGFAHAQDRFFQMDLLRRAGAGELSALFGPAALEKDRERRLHRFRARAGEILDSLPPQDRELLVQYAAGVNDGLARLRVRPFEYLLLNLAPRPWEPADSLLVVWAMYFDLQEDQEARESSRRWLRENCTPGQFEFLAPSSSVYDSPLDAQGIETKAADVPAAAPAWLGANPIGREAATDLNEMIGSNNWAISGARSTTGAAIVADDMHLGLRLPNIWYRSVLQFKTAPGVIHHAAGVTLPGMPFIVAGSNGSIAWGFTNSYGRYLELVELEADPKDGLRLRTPKGWERARQFQESIEIKGEAAQNLTVMETSLGPVQQIGHRFFANHWVAHMVGAVNLGLGRLESAPDVTSALDAANRAGIPAQNILVGDSAGHIGWTIAGPLPVRESPPGEKGAKAAGDLMGDALLAPSRYPRIIDPADGQLWTANNRQLAGPAYALVGDGGADIGARARQIRARLATLPARASERDLADIAFDDRALFLAGWRERALHVLDANATADHPERTEFRRVIDTQWSGRAAVDSAAYTLVREFFNGVYAELFSGVDAQLKELHPRASFAAASPRWPVTVARLLDDAPAGWLPGGRSWRDLQLAAIDHAIANLTQGRRELAAATWGERNRSRIGHPFTQVMPFLWPFLAAKSEPQAGDKYMPHVAAPKFGQSERLVISPGHEEQALFSMPGGQSGHPLSPNFLSGHDTWMKGKTNDFLPGAPKQTIEFAPAGR